MNITGNIIEIFLSDLSEDAKKEIQEIFPDNNWDVFPLAELYIEPEED